MSPALRSHPARRPDIEDALSRQFHVEWDFVAGVSAEEFNVDASLANQARLEEPVNEDTVERYREAAERGDVFPAVVAYRPGRAKAPLLVNIDGNHRLVAHMRAHEGQGLPLAVYEVARATRPQIITLMTMSFNTKHGRPTSEKERIHHALYLIDNGSSADAAATAMNVPVRLVKAALARAKADERAKEVGVDLREWHALTDGQRRRLIAVGTDEGFARAVHTTHAAGLGAEEVNELTALLNQSGRSAKRHNQIMDAEDDRLRERIQSNGAGTMPTATQRRKVTPKARLSSVLGQVLSLPEDIDTLAATFSPAERDDAVQRVTDAYERLGKLLAALSAP